MAKIQADYDKLSEVSVSVICTVADSFYAEWSEVVTSGTQRLMDAL
ncbi:MAG: hypothetical protein ACYDBJ_05710 [Aggregatilineales bacterium]